MTPTPDGVPDLPGSARPLLRWQFKCVHDFLDAAIEQLPTEAGGQPRSGRTPAIVASYAQAVLSEDLAVNGVLAKGTPLALSTWLGRTGLSELPACPVAADWDAWARRVRLDHARLRSYARAVFASTDGFIAALSEDAFSPAWRDGPGCLLSSLVVTLSMRAGEIAFLLVLVLGPGACNEGTTGATSLQ